LSLDDGSNIIQQSQQKKIAKQAVLCYYNEIIIKKYEA